MLTDPSTEEPAADEDESVRWVAYLPVTLSYAEMEILALVKQRGYVKTAELDQRLLAGLQALQFLRDGEAGGTAITMPTELGAAWLQHARPVAHGIDENAAALMDRFASSVTERQGA